MSESLKRGLRERSKRRHFDSDVNLSICKNEEAEQYAYKHSYSKEFVNPSQQLNQQAKLLIKFINNANKYYNQHQQDSLQIESEPNKAADKRESRVQKKQENPKENMKKNGEGGKSAEADTNRKGKQIYSNGKNKGGQKLSLDGLSIDDKMKELRQIGLASANSILQLQKIVPRTAKGNPISLNKYLKDIKAKKIEKNKFMNATKQKTQANIVTGVDRAKFKAPQSKPFKRASYHVAIAYHIYFEENRAISENGTKDPTFASRKLKEQMGKKQ